MKRRAFAVLLSATTIASSTFAQEREITLHEALEHADDRAPAVLVAIAELARGEAAREGASPDVPDNPALEFSAGPRISGQVVDADFSVALSQRFEIAGEPGARRAAADRIAQRYEAQLARVRWEAHWQVHQAYHLALVARDRALALERVIEFAEEVQRVTEQRERAGDATPLDIRVARVDVAQARQAAIAARQEYRAARLTLAEAAGLPTDPLPTPIGALDPPRRAPPIEELLHTALEESPALRVLESAIAEAEARREAADREVWPEPALGVRYSREGSQGMGSPPSDVVLGFLSIPFPFAQQNQGPRAQARADVEIANAELDALRQVLPARVTRTASAVDAAAERVALYGSDILPAFEEALTMLRRGFELGELTILDVAVARERFLRLQLDALGAWADYHRALAELESVVGAEVMEDHAHGERR